MYRQPSVTGKCLPSLKKTVQELITSRALLLLDPEAAVGDAGSVLYGDIRHLTIRQEAARAAVEIWGLFLARSSAPVERIAPLTLPSIYSALLTWTKTAKLMRSDESIQAINVLKNALTLIDKRWKVAGIL